MEATIQNETIRKNILLPKNLSIKADEISAELGINFSELLRKALEDFVGRMEMERVNREIAEACRFYYGIDKEIATEWRSAEGSL